MEPSISSTKRKNPLETPKLCPCRLWMLYEVVGVGNHCCFENMTVSTSYNHFTMGIQPSGKDEACSTQTTSRWKSHDLWIGIYQNHTSPTHKPWAGEISTWNLLSHDFHSKICLQTWFQGTHHSNQTWATHAKATPGGKQFRKRVETCSGSASQHHMSTQKMQGHDVNGTWNGNEIH